MVPALGPESCWFQDWPEALVLGGFGWWPRGCGTCRGVGDPLGPPAPGHGLADPTTPWGWGAGGPTASPQLGQSPQRGWQVMVLCHLLLANSIFFFLGLLFFTPKTHSIYRVQLAGGRHQKGCVALMPSLRGDCVSASHLLTWVWWFGASRVTK